MQIEIKLDSNCSEPRVIIVADQMSEEINDIIKKLSDITPQIIAGYKDDLLAIIEPDDFFRIYSNAGKVYGVTKNGDYTLKLRLYEVEERLNPERFVRISNSEIINLKKVRNFDLSLSGTICVHLNNQDTSYVSRRYVSKIKKLLGI